MCVFVCVERTGGTDGGAGWRWQRSEVGVEVPRLGRGRVICEVGVGAVWVEAAANYAAVLASLELLGRAATGRSGMPWQVTGRAGNSRVDGGISVN